MPRQSFYRTRAGSSRRLFDELQARLLHLNRGDGLIEQPDRGRALELIRSSTRQQLVEQYAQGVQITARIDRIAARQLGAGIVRCQRSAVDAGQRWLIRLFSLKQPSNAKIQQTYLSGLGHQNV